MACESAAAVNAEEVAGEDEDDLGVEGGLR